MKKLKIGEMISIHFSDRKNPIFGIVEGSSVDWILLNYNPVDYQIDGYIVVKRKNISNICRGQLEKFREKIIKLKGHKSGRFKSFRLGDLAEILNQLTAKYRIFQLEKKSDAACYIGRLKSIDDKNITIHCLNPKARWDGQLSFKPDAIRVIEFDTDYINSLKLIAKGR